MAWFPDWERHPDVDELRSYYRGLTDGALVDVLGTYANDPNLGTRARIVLREAVRRLADR